MSTPVGSQLAEQLLDLLNELTPGKGYDLRQLETHVGAQSFNELILAAEQLQKEGQVSLVEMSTSGPRQIIIIPLRSSATAQTALSQDGSPTVASAPGGVSLDVGNDEGEEEEERSIIADASVGLMSTMASSSVRSKPSSPASSSFVDTISKTAGAQGRGTVRAAVAAEEKTKSEQSFSPPSSSKRSKSEDVGSLTIRYILLTLSAAIEEAQEIPNKDKWPLIEKISAVADHPTIQKWLTTPLSQMVD